MQNGSSLSLSRDIERLDDLEQGKSHECHSEIMLIFLAHKNETCNVGGHGHLLLELNEITGFGSHEFHAKIGMSEF